MKSREVFRLAIKIIGFIVLLQGFRNVFEALMILKGYANTRLSTSTYWIAWGLIKIVAGLYFIVARTPLVDLAFPLKSEKADVDREMPSSPEITHVPKINSRLVEARVIFGLIVKTIGLIIL